MKTDWGAMMNGNQTFWNIEVRRMINILAKEWIIIATDTCEKDLVCILQIMPALVEIPSFCSKTKNPDTASKQKLLTRLPIHLATRKTKWTHIIWGFWGCHSNTSTSLLLWRVASLKRQKKKRGHRSLFELKYFWPIKFFFSKKKSKQRTENEELRNLGIS